MPEEDDCIEQPCPYRGYTDTKKCWFHSQGLPLPPDASRGVDCGDAPKTFAEELADEEANG